MTMFSTHQCLRLFFLIKGNMAGGMDWCFGMTPTGMLYQPTVVISHSSGQRLKRITMQIQKARLTFFQRVAVPLCEKLRWFWNLIRMPLESLPREVFLISEPTNWRPQSRPGISLRDSQEVLWDSNRQWKGCLDALLICCHCNQTHIRRWMDSERVSP